MGELEVSTIERKNHILFIICIRDSNDLFFDYQATPDSDLGSVPSSFGFTDRIGYFLVTLNDVDICSSPSTHKTSFVCTPI